MTLVEGLMVHRPYIGTIIDSPRKENNNKAKEKRHWSLQAGAIQRGLDGLLAGFLPSRKVSQDFHRCFYARFCKAEKGFSQVCSTFPGHSMGLLLVMSKTRTSYFTPKSCNMIAFWALVKQLFGLSLCVLSG